MTETTIPAPRRGVPLWAQVTIWVFLVGLLAIVAMGLRRAQQGTVQPGQKIDNFTLPLYRGYQIGDKSEIQLENMLGKVVVKKFGITYANGADLGTRISQYFRIKGVPETYFVDKEGVLQYVQVGPFTSLDQIRAQIDPLLK